MKRLSLHILLLSFLFLGTAFSLAAAEPESDPIVASFTARADSIEIEQPATAAAVGGNARWKVTGEIRSVDKAYKPFDHKGKFEIAIHSPAQTFHQSAEEAIGKTFQFRVLGYLRKGQPDFYYVQAKDITMYLADTEQTAAKEGGKPKNSLAPGINAFALDLYRQLGEKPGNVFFSPASVSIALSMAAAGARGETQVEMLKALHVGRDSIPSYDAGRDEMPSSNGPPLLVASPRDSYSRLLAGWNSAGDKAGFRLSVANRLWGQKGLDFLPGFLKLTGNEYGAELGRVDFQERAEAARREINAWVEKQTAGKIKDLMPAGSLNAATRLVLANAVYFKGDWMQPFQKTATWKADFKISPTETVKTDFMRQTAYLGYFENGDLQALVKPYRGGRLAMVVLLPRKVDGLADMEKTLDAESLRKLLSQVQYREVQVGLPKFKVETPSIPLVPLLEKLGIRKAFTASADFSGICKKERLFISAVFHKAFVEVNEKGTEAAAATGMGMAMAAPPPRVSPPVFRADHPFLFLIRDVQNGVILFFGRLERPQ